jgi:transcriptional regulator with XRE-family HTH domain
MARAGLGWTLKELADRAGVNLNTLSRYEAGREVLSGTIEKIEKVLEAEGVIFLFEDATQGPGVRLPRKEG